MLTPSFNWRPGDPKADAYERALSALERHPDGARRSAGLRAARLSGDLFRNVSMTLRYDIETGSLSSGPWPWPVAPWGAPTGNVSDKFIATVYSATPQNGLDVLISELWVAHFVKVPMDARFEGGDRDRAPVMLSGRRIKAISIPEQPPSPPQVHVIAHIVPGV